MGMAQNDRSNSVRPKAGFFVPTQPQNGNNNNHNNNHNHNNDSKQASNVDMQAPSERDILEQAQTLVLCLYGETGYTIGTDPFIVDKPSFKKILKMPRKGCIMDQVQERYSRCKEHGIKDVRFMRPNNFKSAANINQLRMHLQDLHPSKIAISDTEKDSLSRMKSQIDAIVSVMKSHSWKTPFEDACMAVWTAMQHPERSFPTPHTIIPQSPTSGAIQPHPSVSLPPSSDCASNSGGVDVAQHCSIISIEQRSTPTDVDTVAVSGLELLVKAISDPTPNNSTIRTGSVIGSNTASSSTRVSTLYRAFEKGPYDVDSSIANPSLDRIGEEYEIASRGAIQYGTKRTVDDEMDTESDYLPNAKRTCVEHSRWLGQRSDSGGLLCNDIVEIETKVVVGTVPSKLEDDIQVAQRNLATRIEACEANNCQSVTELVPNSIAIPDRNKEGQTAVHAASKKGDVAVLATLIGRGAVVNVQDNNKDTPLHLAVTRPENSAVIELLMKKDVSTINWRNNEGQTALHLAASSVDNDRVIKSLLEHEADMVAKDNDGCVPLHYAAKHGHLAVVICLIRMRASVSATDDLGMTPLHLAAKHNHFAVVRTLVHHGANVLAEEHDGWKPLHFASLFGFVDIVEFLVDQGTPVDANTKWNAPALHIASEQGSTHVVNFLLQRGADPCSKAQDGWTALHNASFNRHLNVAQLLIDQDALVDAQDDEGWTALHLASKQGSHDLVELFLENGANVNRDDNSKTTALHHASRAGWTKIVRVLLEAGADKDATDKNGATPLYVASQMGDEDMVKILIEYEASIRIPTKEGWTPLHIASRDNRVPIVKFLLEKGAVPDQQDKKGWTALHHAALYGRVKVVELLLDQEASINARTGKGSTALRIARRKQHIDLAESLRSRGAIE